MSRHKLVKNLDLDEELDDYDGYGEDEAPEGQLQEGTIRVRQVLGPDFEASDQEIQESLWHYYYDVEKTTNYLLKAKTPKPLTQQSNTTKPGKGAAKSVAPAPYPCPAPTIAHSSSKESAADFFKDCPWLNVPPWRLANIIEVPLHPPGRLLGGSGSGPGKPSKLAALAAARRRQAEEKSVPQQSLGSELTTKRLQEMNLEDQASKVASEGEVNLIAPKSIQTPLSNDSEDVKSRKYISRRRQDSSPDPPTKVQGTQNEMEPDKEKPQEEAPSIVVPRAEPSAFASTLFGMTVASQTPLQAPPSSHSTPLFAPFNTSIPEDAFSGPSPDDVVKEARKRKGTKSNKTPQAPTSAVKSDSTSNGVATDLQKLTVAEPPPRIKSKNLDVLSEFRKAEHRNAANFVVVGHVDAGKSTLMGRLLYDLKIIPERVLSNYRRDASALGKSSFALAWVMDSTSEERAHGVTMDIATNRFSTETVDFTIIDAPGHRDFIPNMIAGASAADFAVLVVDASTGEFESGLQGQTKEHTLLVRSMGVSRLVIAINKLDTTSWSEPRFTEIKQQLTAFLTSANFRAENLSFVPCAGLSGDNIVNRSTVPAAKWYTGPPLLQLLEASATDLTSRRAIDAPLRLPVDDVFTSSAQHPLSISGRITAGSLQTGDPLLALPANETCTVKAIELGTGQADAGTGDPIDWAVAGQNVILHLHNIEEKSLWQGNVLCSPASPVRVVKSFTVKVLAFDHLLPGPVHLHRGRMEVACRITKLLGLLEKSSAGAQATHERERERDAVMTGGRKKKKSGTITTKSVRIIKPGQVCRLEIVVEEEGQAVGRTGVPLEGGAKIVLRSEGRTVATGVAE